MTTRNLSSTRTCTALANRFWRSASNALFYVDQRLEKYRCNCIRHSGLYTPCSGLLRNWFTRLLDILHAIDTPTPWTIKCTLYMFLTMTPAILERSLQFCSSRNGNEYSTAELQTVQLHHNCVSSHESVTYLKCLFTSCVVQNVCLLHWHTLSVDVTTDQ